MQQTRVLIVDDSSFVRQVISELLSTDQSIMAVGAAAEPNVVREIADGVKLIEPVGEAHTSTIGQNAATCVIHGMPKATHDCGATEIELPIDKISGQVPPNYAAIAGHGVRV